MAASSWAWETPRLAKTGAGDALRQKAARALIEAYSKAEDVDYKSTLRASLAMVDHPSTLQLIDTMILQGDASKAKALMGLKGSFSAPTR